jgi:hypothetical protein
LTQMTTWFSTGGAFFVLNFLPDRAFFPITVIIKSQASKSLMLIMGRAGYVI